MPGVTTAYQSGVHGSRPAASAGCILYACSTHSLIYRSDGTSWTTWMTIGSSTTTVASDAIFDAKGDLPVGTGADTAAKLTVGTNGKALIAASGESTGLKWDYPPGYEWDYVEKTTNTDITGTTEGSPTTLLTGNAVTYDGAPVLAHWYSPNVQTPAATGAQILVLLYEGATVLGYVTAPIGVAVSENYGAQLGELRFTPSAGSHTYSVKAIVSTGTGVISGGAGGTGAFVPTFLRITKV